MSDKRKFIFIHPDFQYKCILYVNILCLAIYLNLLVFLTVSMEGIRFWEIFSITIIYHCVLHILTTLIVIFKTHKIVGPIIRVKNYLKDFNKGFQVTTPKFRKRDFFKEFSPILEKMNEGQILKKDGAKRCKRFVSEIAELTDQEKIIELTKLAASEIDLISK